MDRTDQKGEVINIPLSSLTQKVEETTFKL
jgi:hypothetical protein